jgi:hypothetical protein
MVNTLARLPGQRLLVSAGALALLALVTLVALPSFPGSLFGSRTNDARPSDYERGLRREFERGTLVLVFVFRRRGLLRGHDRSCQHERRSTRRDQTLILRHTLSAFYGGTGVHG